MKFERAWEIKTSILANGARIFTNETGQNNYQPHVLAVYDNNASSEGVEVKTGQIAVPEVLALPLIRMIGGSDQMLVKARLNDDSPWLLRALSGGEWVLENDSISEEVGVLERPSFYGLNVGSEEEPILLEQVAQRLGPDMLATMLSNECVYLTMKGTSFGVKKGMGCRFCELGSTFLKSKIHPQRTKPIAQVAEAIDIASRTDSNLKHLIINAGTWLGSPEDGPDYDEVIRRYISLVKQLRNRGNSLHIYCLCIPPRNFDLLSELNDVGGGWEGLTMLASMEVIDEELAKITTPGKYFHYGRDTFWKAFEYAQQIEMRAQTSFIYGLQSFNPLDPNESFDGEKEHDAVVKATKLLTERGIMPLISIYHYSSKSKIGRIPFTEDDLSYALTSYADVVVNSPLYQNMYGGATFGSRVSLPNTLEQDSLYLQKIKNGLITDV